MRRSRKRRRWWMRLRLWLRHDADPAHVERDAASAHAGDSRWIPAFLLIAAATGYAQTKNPVSSALREILPGRQKNTVAAVEEMPADKFGYKPTADQMTFGHLVTHIIESNNLLCGKAAAVPVRLCKP